MARRPSRLRNLGRMIWLDFLWGLRVPQSLFYQFLVSGFLLVLLTRINDEPGYLQILVPGLIGLIVASQAMQGIGTQVSYMRTYGAWRTIRGSPIPMPLYLGALIVGRMVRVLLTVGFLLLIAAAFFGYRFTGSLGLVFGSVVLGVAVFAALGLVVTYSIATPQAVSSVLNVVFLVMLFSSNALFMAEVGWLKALSWVSPLTYFNELVRAAARSGVPAAGALVDLGVLLLWLVVLTAIALNLARRRVEEA